MSILARRYRDADAGHRLARRIARAFPRTPRASRRRPLARRGRISAPRMRPRAAPTRPPRGARRGRRRGRDRGDHLRSSWSAPGYRGAAVDSLPAAAQAASVAGVWAALGAATYLTCAVVGPTVADAFPGYAAWSRSTWPVLGLTCVAAGLAHFALPGGFGDMYPHRGAWGFWYLPGDAEFHVAWTGVAEILGGLGIASALLPLDAPEWITPTAAYVCSCSRSR